MKIAARYASQPVLSAAEGRYGIRNCLAGLFFDNAVWRRFNVRVS